MIQKNYKQEFIRFLLDVGALRFGDITEKDGKKAPYTINAAEIKTGMQFATLGKFYAKCYLDKIGRRQTVLYGPAYKGIPIALSTSFALSASDLDIPFFFNRKEMKDHVEDSIFVGYLPKEKEDIVIVEDIITQGKTLRESFALVQSLSHVRVNAAIIMVDRMEKGTDGHTINEDIAKELGFPIHAIVNIHDIVAFMEAFPSRVGEENLMHMKDYVQTHCIKKRF
ncbi:MAG: orotate phosphoribosyltransferase [Clostridia bacterium]|nr:orotate phosphoribosyltransferase [Clostridia bacterium]